MAAHTNHILTILGMPSASGNGDKVLGLNTGATALEYKSLGSLYQPLDNDLTQIAGLADPNVDTILFWDDSAGSWAHLTIGTNLSISGTTLNATAGAGGYATIQEEGVSVTARTTINFIGDLISAVDDGASKTNVTIAIPTLQQVTTAGNTTTDEIVIVAAGLGVTQVTTEGLTLSNTTAAAVGAQQISPATYWDGFGWKTAATAGSQASSYRAFNFPVQGVTNPYGNWVLQHSVDGGAYANVFAVRSDFAIAIGTGVASESYTIATNGSTADGPGCIALSQNATVHGFRNVQIGGQNTVIDATLIGVFSSATDSHAYAGADYATMLGDAVQVKGESSAAIGFGHWVFDDQGIALNSSNIVGALTSGTGTSGQYQGSLAGGVSCRTVGNRNFVFGLNAQATGANDSYLFGRGITTGSIPIVNSEASSFAVGFLTDTPYFIIHAAGDAASSTGIVEHKGVTKLGSYTDIAEIAAPATPASGFGRLYAKSTDGKLYWKDDAGTEYDLTSTGTGYSTETAQDDIFNAVVDGVNVTTTYNDAGNTFTINAYNAKRTAFSTTSTLDATHYYAACDATSGSMTINLPTAAGITSRVYIIKKIDSSSNTVTIDPNSTETIEGDSTYVLSAQWDYVRLVSNGTNWEVIG